MNFTFLLRSGWLRLWAVMVASLLAASSTKAFFPDPNPAFVFPGGTVTIDVKGSSPTAAVKLTSVMFSNPAFADSDLLPAATRSGTGKVVVKLTGLQAGTTTVTFSGTNNGVPVSGSITLTVLAPLTFFAQVPQTGVAGDPVSTATGEYFGTESVDLDLGGPMPLIFARYVSSSIAATGLADGNFGANRLHNFASKVLSLSAGFKRVILPNGRVVSFAKVGTAWVLRNPLDVPYALVESGANLLFGHPHAKQIWTYDSSGKLTKIEDGKGNTHTLNYTGSLLTSVSDGLGRSLMFAYASNLITSVTDHTATRQVTFSYSGGVLTSATDYGGHTTTYANSAGLPTSITRPVGNVLFTQSYDANNKVGSQTERGTDTSTLGYAPTTTTFTDPTSATLVDTYDASGRITSHADEAGNAITMAYDSAGRRTSVLDRVGDKTSIVYNALNGLPATITNAEGKNTVFTYKARALSGITFYDLIKVTLPDLSARSFTFDAKGNITTVVDELGKIWKYTFNTRGQVLTATNPSLGVTTFTYDSAGNLATMQAPDEGVEGYTYDARFRLTTITHPGGSTILIGYDAKDRITSITDERSKVMTFAYDNNDRLTTVTDPDTNNTTYAYDVLDRVLSVTDRLGKQAGHTFNSRHLIDSVTDRNANTTTVQFDARQRPVSETDAGGQVWARSFDGEGLLLSATNPLGQTSKLKRNRLGQVIEASDAMGNTSVFVRDAMQRVTKTFDPLGRQTTLTYDRRGDLISAIDHGGGTGSYLRDALGNVTRITDPLGGIWSATFLKSGRIATATDPLLKKWSCTYDTRGRLAMLTYPDATTCSVDYDNANNVTNRVFTSGLALPQTYDNLGRLASVVGVDFSYDAEGRLTNAKQNGQDFTATYDDGGRLKTAGYLSGAVTVTYQYDSRDRLTMVSDNVSSTSIAFAYDNAGRLTSMTRTPGMDATFTYDPAGRLTRIQDGAVIDLKYTLTPAGDVASVDYTAPVLPSVVAGAQTLTFGKAGQITKTGYLYDPRGRLVAAPGQVFGWDAASRLTNANGVTLAYNGLGDVTTRTEGANVTRFYNHYAIGLAPIVYEDRPSGADRVYVWTPDGRLLYNIDLGTNTPEFYHFDRVGSTIALSGPASVTNAYAYGPYGEPMAGSSAATQPFLYLGEFGVRAEGTLYHMRARYYDPMTARFLSRDPLPPRLDDPKSLNRYEYAAQNPMRYIDPAGTIPAAYSWNGFYAGNMGGYWDRTDAGYSTTTTLNGETAFALDSSSSFDAPGESLYFQEFNAWWDFSLGGASNSLGQVGRAGVGLLRSEITPCITKPSSSAHTSASDFLGGILPPGSFLCDGGDASAGPQDPALRYVDDFTKARGNQAAQIVAHIVWVTTMQAVAASDAARWKRIAREYKKENDRAVRRAAREKARQEREKILQQERALSDAELKRQFGIIPKSDLRITPRP